MEQPKGFEVKGKNGLYCLLKKSIYGLKQSPRSWYRRFNDYIASLSFQISSYDMCAYINSTTYKDKDLYYYSILITHVKGLLGKDFDMKDVEESRKILN